MRHFTTRNLASASSIAFIIACANNATVGDPLVDQTIRAQGTIALGASHSPGSSAVAPTVSVAFVPDTTAVFSACGETMVDTCTVTQAPDCTSLGCKTGETCGWDDSCNASCKQACTLTCGDNQKCDIASDGSMSCNAIQTFDAGPIAISGTNMPIAVYPPYAWKSSDEGSPFSPGAQLRVQAAGPTGAGFAQFDITFQATTLVEANPSLDKLNLADVFGASDLQLGWIPGNDRVYILASGAGGSARCLANDPRGAFMLPRDVIAQVLGSGTLTVDAISISIERMRLERHKDASTVGSLDDQTIQNQAWIDLVTTSTESITLQACKDSETSCGTKCVDTQTDANNCGSCGSSCNGKACVAGSCQTSSGGTCSSCEAGVNGGTCASCTGDCKSILTCVNTCAGDTTCEQNCVSEYPSGETAFDDYFTCMCGTCASECSTTCGG